jgi:hypothetical protein
MGSVTNEISVSSATKNNWGSLVPLSQINSIAWLRYSVVGSIKKRRKIGVDLDQLAYVRS